ncbi:CDP-diglyceride synthetase [Lacticaseibacillus saniviri JCM 17471 = DSM 24301]|uniref:Phosphatidate cytidylyltransferase n=1 Tax=Lacticaseibacillus saniviri JCM 17471 = DSM 24301 TaxID=1293598 RepID=A0A0R2MYV5_9LACO|nr:CDP-diglyceride synthetase [Lacticaseibacillus saniviri JCM 17471 = DSM 24301]
MALIIFIPILIAGGVWLEIAAAVLALVALSEVFIMRKRILVSIEFVVAALGLLVLVMPSSYLSWLPNHLDRLDLFYVFVAALLLVTVATKNRTTFDDAGISTLAMVYIGIGFHGLIMARNDAGLDTLMYALLTVWLTDSGAYIFGRMLGKHKLWPAISPNKTWEGSLGGVLSALVFAAIYLQFFPQVYSFWTMLLITLVLSVVGQLGDLVESALKRYYDVKDSGKILPGHGGILDRFDSLLFVLPFLHLLGIV